MAGITSGLNPNVVKTALDKEFYQRYAQTPGPRFTSAQDGLVFQQDTTDRAAVIMERFLGVTEWEDTPEQAEYKGDEPRSADQITFTVDRFTKKFNITEEMIEDDQHSLVRNAIAQMGTKARTGQNNKSMALYRNAATTTLVANGLSLLNASHTTRGATFDNTISGAFTVSTLEEGITLLVEQPDTAGDIVGHEAKCLLIPPALFKEAVENLESELLADVTDNNKNWVLSNYGIAIKQSQYLGLRAGGKNDHWFLLGEFHSVMRWVRVPVQTKMLSGDLEANGDSVYRGRYREVYGALSGEALVGFEGA